MTVFVRRLRVADVPALEFIEEQNAVRYPARAGWVKTYRRLFATALEGEPQGIFVAEVEGKVVGGAIARQAGAHRVSGVPHGEVVTLTVAEAMRHEGVGLRLLKECEAYLRVCGCQAVTLMLPADAGESADMFKAAGYRVTAWELGRELT